MGLAPLKLILLKKQGSVAILVSKSIADQVKAEIMPCGKSTVRKYIDKYDFSPRLRILKENP